MQIPERPGAKIFMKIEEIRKKKEISGSEISRRAGQARAWYELTKNTANPRISTLQKIAAALEVDVSDFFG